MALTSSAKAWAALGQRVQAGEGHRRGHELIAYMDQRVRYAERWHGAIRDWPGARRRGGRHGARATGSIGRTLLPMSPSTWSALLREQRHRPLLGLAAAAAAVALATALIYPLKHVAPVHWNHINLTGDYSWRQNKRVEKGGFRPLRPLPRA